MHMFTNHPPDARITITFLMLQIFLFMCRPNFDPLWPYNRYVINKK